MFLSKYLLNRFAKFICLLDFRFAIDVAHVHVPAGENMAEVFPAQMLHQMVIIVQHILESMTFGGHQQSRGPVVPSEKVAITFL